MPNPTPPAPPAPAPKIATTTDRPTRLAPPPKPAPPGPTPEHHEANLHEAVAQARENPDAHTLSDVEGHVAPLHDMDPPTAIKVAARVTGQPNLRRKSDAIDAVRTALAPNRLNAPITKWGDMGEESQTHNPNVEETHESGVTKSARVGVPGHEVPDKVPILPNLSARERRHETKFRQYYEQNPDQAASHYRDAVLSQTKPGEPAKFETDEAKNAHSAWNGKGLTLDERAKNRAMLNLPLHQTANAIAKKAFLQHLDEGLADGSIKPGQHVLVTCGGCGAGKGYALKEGAKTNPKVAGLKKGAAAIWDSAGDQNGTETPWIKEELDKRGLAGKYLYVHADPKSSWADKEKGVVQRAQNPNDGRMVDAHVFADSYAIGAQNHHAFHHANKNDPNSEFMFLDNTGKTPRELPGVPPADLALDRHHLTSYAHQVISEVKPPEHIDHAARMGARVWGFGS